MERFLFIFVRQMQFISEIYATQPPILPDKFAIYISDMIRSVFIILDAVFKWDSLNSLPQIAFVIINVNQFIKLFEMYYISFVSTQ